MALRTIEAPMIMMKTGKKIRSTYGTLTVEPDHVSNR